MTSPVENTGGIYNEIFPFTVKIRHKRYSYRNDGRYFKPNYDHYLDLVEEYVDEVELYGQDLAQTCSAQHGRKLTMDDLYKHLADEESGDEDNKIRVFETGSKRDSDEGKPRVSDLKPYTRLRFGYHMLLGSLKYGGGNFELGQPDDSTLASMHRHLAMYELGDRSECHLSALLFGIQLLMQNEQREGVEVDRYFKLLKDK